MKTLKKIVLLLVLTCSQNYSLAQTKVLIGDLCYYLSGTSASVTSKYGNYRNESYTIPQTVTYNDLDYTVTEIDEQAFDRSTASSIILPQTVKNIQWYAFNYCTNLKHLELGRVESIEQCAFYNCSSLSSIIIPSSLKNFGEYPFIGCSLLREIIYLPNSAPKNWTATSMTYVPDKQSYSSPTYSINDAHVIEMITFDKNEFEYTGQTPTPTWTNNVEGYNASLSMPALSGDVGSHEEWIPVTFTKGDISFTANVVYRYTVNPVKLTAKVTNASRVYGEDNPQFSISYSGFISGENESVLTTQPTISTTATKTSNVGEYPITISGGSATNYELVYEPGVLTITKAPLSAKVDDATKVYGSANPAFTIEYYGLKNEETSPVWTTRPTFTTEATQRSGVGQYEVKAENGVTMNYDLGEITAGTLSVTPAPLTIKANDATRQYYNENPTFSYTCNGFVNGDDKNVLSPSPTLSTTANLSSNVGTYEIRVGETYSPNYSISCVNGTLTITPKTLIASVGNYERAYNEDNPEFEVKYDGFVGDEDENVLSSKAFAKTSATKTSDVGTYKIEVTGGSADNYKFSYSSGTLTINKAEQIISWEQDLNGLKVGEQIELLAVASSGLPITYSMDKNSCAEIYSAGNGKKYLDCKAEGSFNIRASQDGNNNYYSSTRINKTVTIGEQISYEFESDGIYYNIGDNNTVLVTSGDAIYTGDIWIPQQVEFDGTTYYVTGIEPYAFENCTGLTSVNVPDGVTSIEGVFNGCINLTDITLPNSLLTIGDYTFAACSSLTSMTIPNDVTTVGASAFKGCSNLINVTIGNSVASIGNYAFDGCSALSSVTIPNSVESLGSYAFRDCSSLSTATISDNLTSLEYRTFSGCKSLSSVNIPDGVTSIGGYAFSECSSLPTITIPKSVTSIGQRAFYQCTGLESIVSEIASPFAIDENVFESSQTKIYTDATLFVPEGTIDNYKATEGWNKFVIIEEQGSSSAIDSPIIGKQNDVKAIYSIRGERLEHLSKGINIIMLNDGTIKKMVIK